jgi:hypothetical protein
VVVSCSELLPDLVGRLRDLHSHARELDGQSKPACGAGVISVSSMGLYHVPVT